MGRALAKIIWPVVFVYFLTRCSYQWPDVYRWWFVTLAPYPILWCAITGGTKFLLLCLPPPRLRLEDVADSDVYGRVRFTRGERMGE